MRIDRMGTLWKEMSALALQNLEAPLGVKPMRCTQWFSL